MKFTIHDVEDPRDCFHTARVLAALLRDLANQDGEISFSHQGRQGLLLLQDIAVASLDIGLEHPRLAFWLR